MAEILFRGKNLEELRKMPLEEFSKLLKSRQRRSLKRGFTESEKAFLLKVQLTLAGKRSKQIKTHARNMVILPQMVGLTIGVHNGKEFVPVTLTEEMLGHRLGEFSPTCVKVEHSAPGIGATKSSTAIASKAK